MTAISNPLDQPQRTSAGAESQQLRGFPDATPESSHSKDRPERLVRIRSVRAVMKYALLGHPGAMTHPFLCTEAAERLDTAGKYVKQKSKGDLELLVWDAFRTFTTQKYIFEKYKNELIANDSNLSQEELHRRTAQFVADPETPFAHGLGGAVDVTLMRNGTPVDMGTDFDEFCEKAASDWFEHHSPSTSAEVEQNNARKILFWAMEKAGWVSLPFEWWHFDFGTPRWADYTRGTPRYSTVLSPPEFEDETSSQRFVPLRQPRLQTGVAPVFTDAAERTRSLAHESESCYYVRSSHPTLIDLGLSLGKMYEAEAAQLTCSGLSAVMTVAKAFVPVGGRILCHNRVYYECQGSMLHEAKIRGWKVIVSDFIDLEKFEKELTGTNLLMVDNPSNWFLDSFDLPRIARMAAKYAVVSAVDISVQPMQFPLKQGFDIAVISLSKYPSLGFEPGGAILFANPNYAKKVAAQISLEGIVLSPSGAEKILEHLGGLPDRMALLSQKTSKIRDFLEKRSEVREVRTPNAKHCGGHLGGQLTFRLYDFHQAAKMESIISQNALRDDQVLSLACTFGASMTTFEHFASNRRCRNTWKSEDTNEALIPPDMCRIGIGSESVDAIISELEFVLNSSR